MAGEVVKVRFKRRHTGFAVIKNGFRFLFAGAARNWLRNAAGTAPALGSMMMLLLLSSLVALSGLALRNLAVQQAQDASVLHVYMRDDAKPLDVNQLQLGLQADPRVRSVTYVSKDEALRRAQGRPGLGQLANATESNPFPASLDVDVKRIEDVGAVAQSVRYTPPVDPSDPTSYDANAFSRIQTALTVVAIIGIAFLALLAFVAVSVTGNSIRAAIHARRDELTIMQLVGAPRWMVRGPLVIEGALTGAVAGALAGLATLGIALAAIAAGASAFAQIAPGVTASVAFSAAGVVLIVGIVLGSGASLLSVRKHFET